MDEKLKVQIQLHIGGRYPERKTEEAACYDCYARDFELKSEGSGPGQTLVIYKLGFSAKPPNGYKIVIMPRSSSTNTKWVCQNAPSQGDRDYTGEYQFRVRNLSTWDGKMPFDIRSVNSVCQMCIEKVNDFDFENINRFEVTSRGDGGFGSTNV